VPSAFAVLTPRPVWRSFLNGTLTLSAAIMIQTIAPLHRGKLPCGDAGWPQESRQRSGHCLAADRPLCVTLSALMLAAGAR